MDYLQLPCIRVQEAVSRSVFSSNKILAQKSKFIYDKQI